METARPLAPETRRRDRLWFGFRPDKPGKRPGFTDSAGEYRDTQTGWLGREDSNLRVAESKSVGSCEPDGDLVRKLIFLLSRNGLAC
jgi:hypothetical protein